MRVWIYLLIVEMNWLENITLYGNRISLLGTDDQKESKRTLIKKVF